MASGPPATTAAMVSAGRSKPAQGPSMSPWSMAMITARPSEPKMRSSCREAMGRI